MRFRRLIEFQLQCLFTPRREVGVVRRLLHFFFALALTPRTVLRVRRWARAIETAPRQTIDGPETCCVIVLSYRRPANIPWIVLSYLKCDFVGKVVVTNNNPAVDLKSYLEGIDDPRLELVQQTQPTKQGIRFALAEKHSGKFEYFFSPDDDRFLVPQQIRKLFAGLVAEPEVPHGIEGESRVPRVDAKTYPFVVGTVRDGRTDHLTGYYAFTRLHLRRCLETFRGLGWTRPEAVGNGEDIVLSFSGDGQPRIHDLGPILQCESWSLAGVATWQTHQNFFEERAALHDRLADRRRSYAAALR
ncbi:MAG: hypothetical protein KDD11_06975 [Acidobacteria bacterium]|nr:hypothetical protein [Acidobacteriota bacterium]